MTWTLARIRRALLKKRVRIAPARPIVTFSFDDFPLSALTVGGAILESRGARGVYYACAGLAGRNGVAPMTAMREVLARGHELASHTWSHVRCPDTPTPALVEEIRRNRAALPPGASDHFAYPFGANDPRSEEVVRGLCATARTCVPGINAGLCGAHWLRANELYSATGTAHLPALIEENRAKRGWLILFSHDVSETPSPYGCTPQELAATLDAAIASGAEVLATDAAWRRIAEG